MWLARELRRFPFMRLLLPLVFGIILGEYLTIGNLQLGLMEIVLMALMAIPVFSSSSVHCSVLRVWYGIFLFVFLMFFGLLLVNKTNSRMRVPFPHGQIISCVGSVAEPVKEKGRSVQGILTLESYRFQGKWHRSDFKVLMYLAKDSCALALLPGDRLVISSCFEPITNPGNPQEFDYARYMRYRHVSVKTYLSGADYVLLETGAVRDIYHTTLKWRRHLLQVYRNNGIDGDALAVVSALTLGDRSGVTSELRQEWASVGAMHVLAVSGLHVGIIYLLISVMARGLLRFKWGRIVRACLILCIVWLYAFITGLSPSVMRASAMFTFIVVGESLKRPVTVYNSLGVSAFFLLVVDPYLLYYVGFQLSYLAVLGIVFFQPRIYKLWRVKNKILDRLWALTAVSFSAQIGILPLLLYYFHQFPLYFFLTNYVVIPAAGVLIYLALALFLFSWVNWLSNFLGFLMVWVFRAMDESIHIIHGLPFALFKGVWLDLYQVLGLYFVLGMIVLFVIKPRFRWVFLSLLMCLCVQTYYLIDNLQQRDKGAFMVYNHRGHSLYGMEWGHRGVLWTDKLSDSIRVKKSVNNYCLKNGIDSLICLSLAGDNEFDLTSVGSRRELDLWNVLGYRMAVVRDNSLPLLMLKHPIDLDLLILGGDAPLSPQQIDRLFRVNRVVLDASNSWWYRKKWKNYLCDSHISVHDVQSQGAFVIILPER